MIVYLNKYSYLKGLWSRYIFFYYISKGLNANREKSRTEKKVYAKLISVKNASQI